LYVVALAGIDGDLRRKCEGSRSVDSLRDSVEKLAYHIRILESYVTAVLTDQLPADIALLRDIRALLDKLKVPVNAAQGGGTSGNALDADIEARARQQALGDMIATQQVGALMQTLEASVTFGLMLVLASHSAIQAASHPTDMMYVT
jgi:hypothetical protein